MSFRLGLILLAACTDHDEFPDDKDASLADPGESVVLASQRLDKPGTFGEVFYTLTVSAADGFCLETTDALEATWSGVPMIVLQHGVNDTEVDRCDRLKLAIARADAPAGDADIMIADESGTLGVVYAAELFEPGTTVPAMDVWQLEAGKIARFTVSHPSSALTGGSPQLCFMTPTGSWTSCLAGVALPMREVEFLLPADPEVTGAGVGLLKIGAVEGKATRCGGASCGARIDVEIEHPATVTVP